MKNLLLNIVITTIVFAFCFNFFVQTSETKESFNADLFQTTEPIYVSMIQLIANPEKYHQKFIRVIGFVHLQFEGDAICLHEEDYKRGLSKNCLAITVANKSGKQAVDRIDKYMIVEPLLDLLLLKINVL